MGHSVLVRPGLPSGRGHSPDTPAAVGLVLMGIDAEDGGPGGHGPISAYESVVSQLLSDVTNGGTGILVVGGGKLAGDNVTAFWDTTARTWE